MGMTDIAGAPEDAIRNKPMTAELRQVLEKAAQAAGVSAIPRFSRSSGR
jgi:hypothetical protein